MGQTLVNPGAHLMAMLCIGQLQSQSHWALPSGHSHLQEHCISSFGPCPDPGPVGAGPEPDPFPGGIVPDPDPFPGGIVPDPDPFPGGIVPDPDPVVPACPPMVAVVPPVVAAVVGASVVAGETEPFDNLAAPFFTAMSKVKTPDGPFKETLFATPLHFLSQAALDLGLSLVPIAIRLRLQVQVALPTRIF